VQAHDVASVHGRADVPLPRERAVSEGFKFSTGQTVTVLSKDRNLNGKMVKVIACGTSDGGRWYHVSGTGIHRYLAFFEEQLT
jgi:hypothetical protein